MQMQPRYARMRWPPDAAESAFRVPCGRRRCAAGRRIDSVAARCPGPHGRSKAAYRSREKRHRAHQSYTCFVCWPAAAIVGRSNCVGEYPTYCGGGPPPSHGTRDSSYAMTTEGRMGGRSRPIVRCACNQSVSPDRCACAHSPANWPVRKRMMK